MCCSISAHGPWQPWSKNHSLLFFQHEHSNQVHRTPKWRQVQRLATDQPFLHHQCSLTCSRHVKRNEHIHFSKCLQIQSQAFAKTWGVVSALKHIWMAPPAVIGWCSGSTSLSHYITTASQSPPHVHPSRRSKPSAALPERLKAKLLWSAPLRHLSAWKSGGPHNDCRRLGQFFWGLPDPQIPQLW